MAKTTTKVNHSKVIRRAEVATREAVAVGRKILLTHLNKIKNVKTKYKAGLVSNVDVLAEQKISQILVRHLPEVLVNGEEKTTKQKFVESDYVWHLDPLDGTTNYIHGYPIFCISIGLAYKGKIIYGCVDVPVLDQFFEASVGGGAFCNGKRISVSTRSNLADALLATGFFVYEKGILRKQLKVFNKVIGHSRGVRRSGSAAFDLCCVANGIFEGYWETNLQAWDTAAGSLLVKEAGGVVTDYTGNDYHVGRNEILATNRKIHKKLLRLF